MFLKDVSPEQGSETCGSGASAVAPRGFDILRGNVFLFIIFTVLSLQ